MYKAFISLCLVSIIGHQICYGLPKVHLQQGVVQGTFKKSYDGRIYSSFEGIPYAKPPVGNLRFKEPIPASGWNDILIANKSYICSQLDDSGTVVGSEDCLYIYVYVPKEHVDKSDNFDVVVHIHAGSLVGGSPYEMAQPDYVMDKNLIMVTFNYRLGAAGFLSTGDSVVYGNNGFKDQTIALKWIKNNIKEFGGNPQSVTITGFSTGGSSVQFHYLSPLSKGLFHKGFSSSYVVTSSESLTLIPLEKTKQLAEALECPVNSKTTMVECLRGKTIEDLVKKNPVWFKPVVEQGNPFPFIPDVPYRMLKNKKVYDVPWVLSNSIDESMFSLGSVFRNRSEIFSICSNFSGWAPQWLDLTEYVDADKLEDTSRKIKEFYLDNCHLTEENGLEKLNRLMTDRHFHYGSDVSLRLQAAAMRSHVYYYMFKFIPEDELQFDGPHAASHGVDAKLLFKFRTNPDRLKPKGEKMMRMFTKFLYDYARTGTPIIRMVNWIPINPYSQTLNVLEINSPDNMKMKTIKELAPRHFWESLPIKENEHLL